MKIRTRLGLSKRQEARLVRLLQAGLVLIALVGLRQGNAKIVFNAGVSLLVTQLPALLERNYRITLDVGLTLWVTLAVFLHALGSTPLSVFGGTAYTRVWWWDHVTHTLSASVVAAVGYTTARVVEHRSEYTAFPPWFMFAYLLLFVMAAGVVWELVEFYSGFGSALLGIDRVLIQYGLEDTMLDLVFDILGALIVATVGTARLSGLVDQLTGRFDPRTD